MARNLRKEMRSIDRSMREMKREEEKILKEIKKLAKQNASANKSAILVLSKSIVKSRNERSRLLQGKTQVNSISLQLKEQVATMNVTQTMNKSTVIERNE